MLKNNIESVPKLTHKTKSAYVMLDTVNCEQLSEGLITRCESPPHIVCPWSDSARDLVM